MKKYIFLTLLTITLLTGCKSKSSFSFTFEDFSFSLYDNGKIYMPWTTNTTGTQDIQLLSTMKEKTGANDTGYSNSLLVAKVPIASWVDIKDIVSANAKKTRLQVLNYKDITNTKQNIVCGDLEYSWYIMAFSYQLSTETLYGWQYFFTKDTSLYNVSLSSDEKKDVESFVDSIEHIACIK